MMLSLLALLGCPAPPLAVCPDFDADGWCADEDCSDTRADIHPDQPEVWYDGLDTACDGGDDFDSDGDRWPLLREYSGSDCDDGDPAVYPGAPPICGNERDDDCNRWSDCSPAGTLPARDFASASIFGGAPEVAVDLDGDGAPEWAFTTDFGMAFVSGSLTDGGTTEAAPVHLIYGYPMAVGPNGGVDGDGVASASTDIFSPDVIRVWLDPERSTTEDRLISVGEPSYVRSLEIADASGDGIGDVLVAFHKDPVDSIGVFAGPAIGNVALDDAVALVRGVSTASRLGQVQDANADLDGDGVVDLVASEDIYSTVYLGGSATLLTTVPRLVLLFGPLNGTSFSDDAPGIGTVDAPLQFSGPPAFDTRWDWNLDGYSDMILKDSSQDGSSTRILEGPFDRKDRLASDSEAALDFGQLLPMGDLNADGWPDLAAIDGPDLAILYGPFDGEFPAPDVPALFLTDPATLWFPMYAGDVDGDGGAEILVQAGDIIPLVYQETLILTGFTAPGF